MDSQPNRLSSEQSETNTPRYYSQHDSFYYWENTTGRQERTSHQPANYQSYPPTSSDSWDNVQFAPSAPNLRELPQAMSNPHTARVGHSAQGQFSDMTISQRSSGAHRSYSPEKHSTRHPSSRLSRSPDNTLTRRSKNSPSPDRNRKRTQRSMSPQSGYGYYREYSPEYEKDKYSRTSHTHSYARDREHYAHSRDRSTSPQSYARYRKHRDDREYFRSKSPESYSSSAKQTTSRRYRSRSPHYSRSMQQSTSRPDKREGYAHLRDRSESPEFPRSVKQSASQYDKRERYAKTRDRSSSPEYPRSVKQSTSQHETRERYGHSRDRSESPEYQHSVKQSTSRQDRREHYRHSRERSASPDYSHSVKQSTSRQDKREHYARSRDRSGSPDYARSVKQSTSRQDRREHYRHSRERSASPDYGRSVKQSTSHQDKRERYARSRDRSESPEYTGPRDNREHYQKLRHRSRSPEYASSVKQSGSHTDNARYDSSKTRSKSPDRSGKTMTVFSRITRRPIEIEVDDNTVHTSREKLCTPKSEPKDYFATPSSTQPSSQECLTPATPSSTISGISELSPDRKPFPIFHKKTKVKLERKESSDSDIMVLSDSEKDKGNCSEDELIPCLVRRSEVEKHFHLEKLIKKDNGEEAAVVTLNTSPNVTPKSSSAKKHILGNIPSRINDKRVKYTDDIDVQSMSPESRSRYHSAMRQRKRRNDKYLDDQARKKWLDKEAQRSRDNRRKAKEDKDSCEKIRKQTRESAEKSDKASVVGGSGGIDKKLKVKFVDSRVRRCRHNKTKLKRINACKRKQKSRYIKMAQERLTVHDKLEMLDPIKKRTSQNVHTSREALIEESEAFEEFKYKRQYARRARGSLPKEKLKRCAVLAHMVRREMKDEKCRKRLEFEIPQLRSDLKKEVVGHITRAVRYGAKRQYGKVQKTAESVKKKYKSLRKFNQFLNGYGWKSLHNMFNPKVPHANRRITDEDKKCVWDFFRLPLISMELPCKKYSKLRFLTRTLSEAYVEYCKIQKSKGLRILGFSTFCKLRPKQIRLQRRLPIRQCGCPICINACLVRLSLIANGVKPVPKRSTEIVCRSMCPVNGQHPLDILKYKRDCIFNKCKVCKEATIFKQNILDTSPHLKLDKSVNWSRWKYTKKLFKGKKVSAFEKVPHTGKLSILIDLYIQDVRTLRKHLFHLEWQRIQYGLLLDTLQIGEIVFVIDFAKNYSHVFQDEPHSANWDRTQSAFHAVVAFYRCKCGKMTTDEILHISPDLNHDGYIVQIFEEKTVLHLKEQDIRVKCIYEFSDNCPNQYKSKVPFKFLSMSDIPIMRNFLCEYHAKSVADGMIGRMSQILHTEVVANKVDFPSSEVLYKFCKDNLQITSENGECRHYQRHFIYTHSVDRSEEIQAFTVPKTRQIHSIRSVGVPGVVEVRDDSCFCVGCRNGSEECANKHLVEDWEVKYIIPDKVLLTSRNHHWKTFLSRSVKAEPLREVRDEQPKPVKKTSALQSSSNRGKRSTIPAAKEKQDTVTKWSNHLKSMRKCSTFEELKDLVNSITDDHHMHLSTSRHVTDFEIDQLACSFFPPDAPKDMTPIKAQADGNCFMRSVSRIVFGDEGKHEAVRAAVVYEGVKHESFFLDNHYLTFGHKNDNVLTSQYAIYCGAYNSVATASWNSDVIRRIYECEMLDMTKIGCYCGMWQFYQAANVIGRPIKSIYPMKFLSQQFRPDMNRIAYPIRLHEREKEPVCIMWTPMRKESITPNHLVPVVKITDSRREEEEEVKVYDSDDDDDAENEPPPARGARGRTLRGTGGGRGRGRGKRKAGNNGTENNSGKKAKKDNEEEPSVSTRGRGKGGTRARGRRVRGGASAVSSRSLRSSGKVPEWVETEEDKANRLKLAAKCKSKAEDLKEEKCDDNNAEDDGPALLMHFRQNAGKGRVSEKPRTSRLSLKKKRESKSNDSSEEEEEGLKVDEDDVPSKSDNSEFIDLDGDDFRGFAKDIQSMIKDENLNRLEAGDKEYNNAELKNRIAYYLQQGSGRHKIHPKYVERVMFLSDSDNTSQSEFEEVEDVLFLLSDVEKEAINDASEEDCDSLVGYMTLLKFRFFNKVFDARKHISQHRYWVQKSFGLCRKRRMKNEEGFDVSTMDDAEEMLSIVVDKYKEAKSNANKHKNIDTVPDEAESPNRQKKSSDDDEKTEKSKLDGGEVLSETMVTNVTKVSVTKKTAPDYGFDNLQEEEDDIDADLSMIASQDYASKFDDGDDDILTKQTQDYTKKVAQESDVRKKNEDIEKQKEDDPKDKNGKSDSESGKGNVNEVICDVEGKEGDVEKSGLVADDSEKEKVVEMEAEKSRKEGDLDVDKDNKNNCSGSGSNEIVREVCERKKEEEKDEIDCKKKIDLESEEMKATSSDSNVQEKEEESAAVGTKIIKEKDGESEGNVEKKKDDSDVGLSEKKAEPENVLEKKPSSTTYFEKGSYVLVKHGNDELPALITEVVKKTEEKDFDFSIQYFVKIQNLGYRLNDLNYHIWKKEIIAKLHPPEEKKSLSPLTGKTVRVNVFEELTKD